MADFPPEKVQQYRDAYGQHPNIKVFATTLAADRAKQGWNPMPSGQVVNMYLAMHPERAGEALNDPPSHTNTWKDDVKDVLRDTAMAVPAIAGGMAGSAGAGAAGLGYLGTAAARVAGAGLANMGGSAIARYFQGVPQAPLQDLAMGAGGEALGMGVAGATGAAKGAITGMGREASFLPSVAKGSQDALKGYLRPFGTPVAPNKSSLTASGDLAALKQLPDYDIRNLAAAHPQVGEPAGIGQNIVPNLTAEGEPGRMAGLASLDNVKGNLDASRQYHTSQQAAARARAAFSPDQEGSRLATSAQDLQDSVRKTAQVTVAERPQLPVSDRPALAAPTIQPRPVVDPPTPQLPPQPPMPSAVQTPTGAEASQIAGTRGALVDYLGERGSRPVSSGVVDSRSPGAASLREAINQHGGKEVAPGVTLPEGPQPMPEIQQRVPFNRSGPASIGRAVNMDQTMPNVDAAQDLNSFLRKQTGRATNSTPVSGETQVPMRDADIVKAMKDPTAFTSTARDPAVETLKGRVDQATAAPQQRELENQWVNDRKQELFSRDQQEASQNASVADRRANNQAVADEANASNSAKAQHEVAKAQAERDHAERTASVLRQHDLRQPQVGSRPLTPQELAASYQNPAALEGTSVNPEAMGKSVNDRYQNAITDEALSRLISTRKEHLDAASALSDRGLGTNYQPKGAGINSLDQSVQHPHEMQVRNQAYVSADEALARLRSNQSISTGPDGVPQIVGSREDAAHPIVKKVYNTVMDKLFRHEPQAVTDAKATPRLLDLANLPGASVPSAVNPAAAPTVGGSPTRPVGKIFPGVKSDVMDPLMPTPFHGAARAVGGLMADTAGQGIVRGSAIMNYLKRHSDGKKRDL